MREIHLTPEGSEGRRHPKHHITERQRKLLRRLKEILARAEPSRTCRFLSEYLKGQEDLKQRLSTAIWRHYISLKNYIYTGIRIPTHKTNILIIGPTGSGKTFVVELLSEYLDVPLLIINARTIADTSYKGTSIEEHMQKLLDFVEDKDELVFSIIVIDEIDKLALRFDDSNNSKQSIQSLLLKIVEGDRLHTEKLGTSTIIDTTPMLFIAIGAFEGWQELITTSHSKSIGLVKPIYENQDTQQQSISYALREYGIMPELLGRFPIIIQTGELGSDLIKNILMHSKSSPLKHWQTIFKEEFGIKLEFSEDALDIIAEATIKLGLGVRGAYMVLAKVLDPLLYSMTGNSIKQRHPQKLIIDRKRVQEALLSSFSR